MLFYAICSFLALALALLWQSDTGKTCLIAEEFTRIKAPRQKIFEMLTDLPGYNKWHPGLGRVSTRDPTGPVGIGKEYKEVANLPQGETIYKLVVTGYTPNSYFSFTTDSAMENVHEFSLELDGPGVTKVNHRIFSRRRSYLFHYVLSPFLSFAFTNQVMQTLVNLKVLF